MKVATLVGVSGAVAVGSILAYFGYQQYQAESSNKEEPVTLSSDNTNEEETVSTENNDEANDARSVVSNFLKNLGNSEKSENAKVTKETTEVPVNNKVGVWKNFWEKEYQAQDSDKKEEYNS